MSETGELEALRFTCREWRDKANEKIEEAARYELALREIARCYGRFSLARRLATRALNAKDAPQPGRLRGGRSRL